MGLRVDKVKAECRNFGATVRRNLREIFVENRPRWRQPKEWQHLVVDPFVSAFDILKAAIMPYTLGHLAFFITIIEAIKALAV